jgi:hypothetical protein
MVIRTIWINFLRIITRPEKVITKTNQIIIYPTAVESKESHKCNHIPQLGESFQKPTFLLNPMIIDNKIQP